MNLSYPHPIYTQLPDHDSSPYRDDVELDSLHGPPTFGASSTERYGSDASLLYGTRVDTSHNPEKIGKKAKSRRFASYRFGACTAAVLATITLFVNIGVLIRVALHPSSSNGLLQIYTGDCEAVRRMNLWVHLAINVLSTLLLGGSNYCMQCLSSPTRSDIDLAHSSGRFMNVGILSIRNLGFVTRRKRAMWWMLALSSIPLHLLYNSAFYGSLATSNYDIFVTDVTYANGANFTTTAASCQIGNNTAVPSVVESNGSGQFHRLETAECIRSYAQTVLTGRRNLVLVSSNATNIANDSLHHLAPNRFDNQVQPSAPVYAPFDWICQSDPFIDSKIQVPMIESPQRAGTEPAPCDSYYTRVEAIGSQWTPFGYSIDYCLSEQIPETCSFNANLSIIIVVIVCNVIKAVVMFVVALKLETPLITVGDAVESFLNRPDWTTAGRCWLNEKHVKQCEYRWFDDHKKMWPKSVQNGEICPAEVDVRSQRWSSAPGSGKWALTIFLFVAALATSVGFLGASITALRRYGESALEGGFGQLQVAAIITGWVVDDIRTTSGQIIVSVLFANFPQAVLSFLYLNVNGLLTSMWVTSEWNDFVKERKHLRVSNPKEDQRSTYFLQLPYKVAVPLLTTSSLLHWLISQSIFLAVIATYTCSGELENAAYIASCGFSSQAILTTICVATVIFIAVIGISYQRYPGGIPFVSTCSAAISAACHPPSWDNKAALKALKYGAIPDGGIVGSTIGHCSFSSGEVHAIEPGKLYAGKEKWH